MKALNAFWLTQKIFPGLNFRAPNLRKSLRISLLGRHVTYSPTILQPWTGYISRGWEGVVLWIGRPPHSQWISVSLKTVDFENREKSRLQGSGTKRIHLLSFKRGGGGGLNVVCYVHCRESREPFGAEPKENGLRARFL